MWRKNCRLAYKFSKNDEWLIVPNDGYLVNGMYCVIGKQPFIIKQDENKYRDAKTGRFTFSPYGKSTQIANTLDDAKTILYCIGIEKLDIDGIDDKLAVCTAEQMAKLERRFKVLRQLDYKVMTLGNTEGVSEVIYKLEKPHEVNIVFSNREYRTFDYINQKIAECVKLKRFMPCAEENYGKYVVTHEYGHLLFNVLLRDRFVKNGWDKSFPIGKENFEAKTIKAKTSWYANHRDALARELRKEILSIAKKANHKFDVGKNVSSYAKTSNQEFFAEVFANSQLGKPNELGKAMNVFLRDNMIQKR